MSAPTIAGTDVVRLAEDFAATLSEAQLAELLRERTFANAANWSNLPQGYLGDGGRLGLRTGTLSGPQWAALEALLAAATGSGRDRGFDALRAHLDADDWLRARSGNEFYGRGNFFVAFLGTPAPAGTWELQLGGHHLALANTYVDGVLAGATPSFRGIEPFGGCELDGRRCDPERGKHEALVGLLASFDRDQRSLAHLDSEHRDVLLGPGRDSAFPARPEGIAGRDLSAAQADRLLAAIESFVADVEDAAAARILAGYERELDSTFVAYAGSPGLGEAGDYVRIDGPAVWVEYSMHPGGVLPDPHPHALWRDKRTDYGGRVAP